MPKDHLDIALTKIDGSPYDRTRWEELFSLQRRDKYMDESRFTRIRSYRYGYVEKFLAPPTFWLEWITEETEHAVDQGKAGKDDEKTQVPLQKLFTEALKACPHYDIASSYIDYVKERHSMELTTANDVRKAFDEALDSCGLDIVKGAKLWSSYLDFEVEDFEDKQELHMNDEAFGTDVKTLKEAKTRLVELFHRQLSLPLTNTEETLARLEAVTEEYFSEEDMCILKPEELNEHVERAMKQRQTLVPFESKVSLFEDPTGGSGDSENATKDDAASSTPSVPDMVASWCSYVDFELGRGCHDRMRRVFERAVISIHLHSRSEEKDFATQEAVTRLWTQYIEAFLLKDTEKEDKKDGVNSLHYVIHVTTNALKVCFSNFGIWKYHWLALEAAGTDTMTLQTSHHSALQAGLRQGEDYIGVLVCWCEYLARRIETVYLTSTTPTNSGDDAGPSGPPAKRKRGNKDSLSNDDSVESSVESLLVTYIESVEHSERWLEQVYPSWEEAWLRWARCVAETEHSFSLMGLGVPIGEGRTGDVWDRLLARFPFASQGSVSEALKWQLLKCYERPADRLQVLQKCRDMYLCNITEGERLVNSAAASFAHAQSLLMCCNEWETFERKHGDLDSVLKCLRVTGAARSRVETVETIGENDAQARPPPSRNESIPVAGSSPSEEKEKEGGPTSTVHFKSLHFDATEEDIQAVLKPLVAKYASISSSKRQAGELQPQVYLPRAHSGRSKGEAYVTFDSISTSQKLVASAAEDEEGIKVRGRRVLLSVLPEAQLKKIEIARDALPSTTVFVAGFPKEWQIEHLLTFFSHCGDILAGKVLKRQSKTAPSSSSSLSPTEGGLSQGIVQFKEVLGRQNACQMHKYEFTQVGHVTKIQVTLSKHPIISPEEASGAPVKVTKADSMTIPYIPPQVTELAKGKPKRAGSSFKPSALL